MFEVCHRIRSTFFIKPMTDIIKGSNILELAPNEGQITKALAQAEAKSITAIEFNSGACEDFSRNLLAMNSSARIDLIEADLHKEILNFKPKTFDIIVCAGFLYHTPHPFWVLESMAALAPQYILIDTFISDQLLLKLEPQIKTRGQRQVVERHVPYALMLSKELICESMLALGFEKVVKIEKSNLEEEFKPELINMNEDEKSYMRSWKDGSFTAWFKRIN